MSAVLSQATISVPCLSSLSIQFSARCLSCLHFVWFSLLPHNEIIDPPIFHIYIRKVKFEENSLKLDQMLQLWEPS